MSQENVEIVRGIYERSTAATGMRRFATPILIRVYDTAWARRRDPPRSRRGGGLLRGIHRRFRRADLGAGEFFDR